MSDVNLESVDETLKTVGLSWLRIPLKPSPHISENREEQSYVTRIVLAITLLATGTSGLTIKVSSVINVNMKLTLRYVSIRSSNLSSCID